MTIYLAMGHMKSKTPIEYDGPYKKLKGGYKDVFNGSNWGLLELPEKRLFGRFDGKEVYTNKAHYYLDKVCEIY